MARPRSTLTALLELEGIALPSPAQVMTATVDLPPGDPGTAPHRRGGPVFGVVLQGALLVELQGEKARVVGPGEAFWEPGGEVIHWQAANALAHSPTRFAVVMTAPPGEPMLTVLGDDELARHGRLALAAPDGRPAPRVPEATASLEHPVTAPRPRAAVADAS